MTVTRLHGRWSRRTLTIVLALALGLVVILSGVTVAFALGDQSLRQQTAVGQGPTNWPANARGQSYGSALFADSPDDEPDLIMATATNGKDGYVLKTDLDGPTPGTPEEALSRQAERAGKVRVIPVYGVDGVTIIGEFVIDPPGEARVVTPGSFE